MSIRLIFEGRGFWPDPRGLHQRMGLMSNAPPACQLTLNSAQWILSRTGSNHLQERSTPRNERYEGSHEDRLSYCNARRYNGSRGLSNRRGPASFSASGYAANYDSQRGTTTERAKGHGA
jgi:hypothetical protein